MQHDRDIPVRNNWLPKLAQAMIGKQPDTHVFGSCTFAINVKHFLIEARLSVLPPALFLDYCVAGCDAHPHNATNT